MKTTLPKESEIVRQWHVVDATGKPVGRLAVRITELLRGKNKTNYTPHIDTGDFVVVINAAKVKLTGNKEEKKEYQFFSRYPSGLKRIKASIIRAKHPDYIITHAVKDMLPKNHMSRQLFTRLKVYAGADHPHTAQKPQELVFKD
ncbi:MAG: 50S ribosomal protein L13 [Lentisphaerota bacterium]